MIINTTTTSSPTSTTTITNTTTNITSNTTTITMIINTTTNSSPTSITTTITNTNITMIINPPPLPGGATVYSADHLSRQAANIMRDRETGNRLCY